MGQDNFFSVNNFLGVISSTAGLARQNRYVVRIPTVSLAAQSTTIYQAIMASITNGDETEDWMNTYFNQDPNNEAIVLAAYCEKAELPGYQFQCEAVRTYGPVMQFPHMPEYQNITLSFMCGGGMDEKRFFEAWMYMIMDPITNNFNYIQEYAVELAIVQYPEGPNQYANTNGFATPPSYLEWWQQDYTETFNSSPQEILPAYGVRLIDAFPVAINPQELAFDSQNTIQRLAVTFTYKWYVPLNNDRLANSKSSLGSHNNGKSWFNTDSTQGPTNNGTTSVFSQNQNAPSDYAFEVQSPTSATNTPPNNEPGPSD